MTDENPSTPRTGDEPTEQVEVRRFGPPPTQAAPSPYTAPPWSTSPPVAAAPAKPERRRVASGGVVALAVVAGIISGSLSAAAVTTLLADENGNPTTQTPLGTNVGDARASGSGLGLAIARSIVEMHGGRIEAASAIGQGSVFSVQLPRSEAIPASEGS